MKLKNVQIRMFNNDVEDSIVDFSLYSSDLFLGPSEYRISLLQDICFHLSENYHIDTIRVWGENVYNIIQCNDYDCHKFQWINKEWILLRENHLNPKPVYILDTQEVKLKLGIMYDEGTHHVILNIDGEDHDAREAECIYNNPDVYQSDRWVWSEDKKALNTFIQSWSHRFENFINSGSCS